MNDQFSLLQNPKSRVWQVSVLGPMFSVYSNNLEMMVSPEAVSQQMAPK